MQVKGLPYVNLHTNAPNRVSDSIWNADSEPSTRTSITQVSSRTLVMNFAGCRRYRFIARVTPECRDAQNARLPNLKKTAMAAAACGWVHPGDFVESASGRASGRL